jgi:hypothetical protein
MQRPAFFHTFRRGGQKIVWLVGFTKEVDKLAIQATNRAETNVVEESVAGISQERNDDLTGNVAVPPAFSDATAPSQL